jgi:hypothetical protein
MLNETWPALIIPAIVGPFLLFEQRRYRYNRLPGWSTLTPVMASHF